MSTDLEQWLSIVEDDYLRYFIPHGGSAVKFAVVPSTLAAERTRSDLRRLADTTNCQFVYLNAATARINRIDQSFHAVAQQINWDALTTAFLSRMLAEQGFTRPGQGRDITYKEIADCNAYDESEVRVELRNALRDKVHRDFGMTREFRIAMMRLCQSQLSPTADEVLMAEAIKSWLRGELRLLAAVKSALIFQKIALHNARDMFLSLAHWVRVAGHEGLLIVMDISRCLESKKPMDGTLSYTPNNVLDAYEVLRQFVDTTDELQGCFMTVIAPHAFLEDPKRGLERYTPLHTRVSNDVHDRHRSNPLASLVEFRTDSASIG